MSLKRKAGALPLNDAKKPKTNASITSFFGVPKPKTSTPVKVNGSTCTGPASSALISTISEPTSNLAADNEWKGKWVASLTDEQRNLLVLEIESLHVSWLKELRDEVTSSGFLDLKRFLKREHETGQKIFPPAQDVYAWSRHTPLNTVKAVIIGQDPYHNDNQAHGLCFSVQTPTPAPPSLLNIYKCLQNDYPSFCPPPNRSGNLTSWADRGVLLLNTCLTVRAHNANSHANRGWEKFTSKVIEIVCRKRTKGVVFLAWGSPAAKRVVGVDRKKHCVLLSVHPSPLSARRGFFECAHFRKTNEWLAERYGEQIDWSLSGVGTAPAVVPNPAVVLKSAVVPNTAVVLKPAVVEKTLEEDEDAEQIMRDAEAALRDAEESEMAALPAKSMAATTTEENAEQVSGLGKKAKSVT
ncbi:uracil-DNA glycosylase [Calycina marina]|uniref:Uracil-DNA glycosylase n=1 Tax=Calycina marina TaxID=1763456 RepID=A0A9P8CJA4_9HELO|nr:uracil-DNA glycosylase [Calycina marina]